MTDDEKQNRQSRRGQDANGAPPQHQFTPEELRKAERVQIILYIVMAVLILLPFIFLWLRK